MVRTIPYPTLGPRGRFGLRRPYLTHATASARSLLDNHKRVVQNGVVSHNNPRREECWLDVRLPDDPQLHIPCLKREVRTFERTKCKNFRINYKNDYNGYGDPASFFAVVVSYKKQ